MDINDPNRDNLNIIVCDDSSLMRNLISRIIDAVPGMNVIAKAENGQKLLEILPNHQVDCIVLDIEMPIMTGVDFLRERKRQKIGIPVIILSSVAVKGASITMECLELGASDFITKPGGSISINIGTVGDELIEQIASYGGTYARGKGKRIPHSDYFMQYLKLKEAQKFITEKKDIEPTIHNNQIRPLIDAARKQVITPATIVPEREGGKIKIIAIGISTGGPNALREVFMNIDPHLSQPILVVQHMPQGFTAEFAKSLDKICPLTVVEAADNMPIERAHIYIAPGGFHIAVEERTTGNVIRTNKDLPRNGHRPSADVLFESVAKIYKNNALGVIMTGMGNDGSAQLAKMRKEGAYTIGQDERSSIVYGMPKVAYEMGAVQKQYPLKEIADAISTLARTYK